MANMGDWEQKNLLNELNLGMELAKQLQFQLNSPSSSRETREMLVHKILASYHKLLSMLNSSGSTGEIQSIGVGNGMSESPSSLNGSPKSEDSDRDFKDLEYKDGVKKRNSIPRWTKQVRVNPGMGLEGPLDDGFSWRKYGQKDILGAKHPRGYYRCTHRNVQGCLATKQVQRSDEDSTIFEITYRGRHTCSQANHTPPTTQSSENQELKTNIDPHHKYQQTLHENQQLSRELLSNFSSHLKVITKDLDSQNDPTFPPSFEFPSTSNVNPENRVLSSPLVDDSFMGNYSPAFMPSSASSTPYFSASQNGVHHNFVGNQNFQLHQSDHLPEHDQIISAATSATNSPTIGMHFPFGNVEFDPNFTFGSPGFLP